jgi:hypothetical protein
MGDLSLLTGWILRMCSIIIHSYVSWLGFTPSVAQEAAIFNHALPITEIKNLRTYTFQSRNRLRQAQAAKVLTFLFHCSKRSKKRRSLSAKQSKGASSQIALIQSPNKMTCNSIGSNEMKPLNECWKYNLTKGITCTRLLIRNITFGTSVCKMRCKYSSISLIDNQWQRKKYLKLI